MNGLYASYEKQKQISQQQEKLRSKHHIQESSTTVVEKWFVFRYLGQMVRILCTIVILVLSSIGLVSIIYPDTRTALLQIVQDIQLQLAHFLS